MFSQLRNRSARLSLGMRPKATASARTIPQNIRRALISGAPLCAVAGVKVTLIADLQAAGMIEPAPLNRRAPTRGAAHIQTCETMIISPIPMTSPSAIGGFYHTAPPAVAVA